MIFYNGDDLIRALKADKANKGVVAKLYRVMSLQSIFHDLGRCLEAVELLIERASARNMMEVTPLSREDGLIDSSLMTYIVTQYAACTDTASMRGKFDPRRHYSEKKKDWHKGIIELRNQAISHFGPGSHRVGYWSKDSLSVVINPVDNQIEGFGLRPQRANFRGPVLLELRELIPDALAGLEKDIDAAMEVATEGLMKIPNILTLIKSMGPAEKGQGDRYERMPMIVDGNGNFSQL